MTKIKESHSPNYIKKYASTDSLHSLSSSTSKKSSKSLKSSTLSEENREHSYTPIPLSTAFVVDNMLDLVSSQFCDITMALLYLFTSNDFEVLERLGIKLKVLI